MIQQEVVVVVVGIQVVVKDSINMTVLLPKAYFLSLLGEVCKTRMVLGYDKQFYCWYFWFYIYNNSCYYTSSSCIVFSIVQISRADPNRLHFLSTLNGTRTTNHIFSLDDNTYIVSLSPLVSHGL